MGKLLALELFNFKSYKGHHVLQFGDSYFTSIIGPNGSGKSNSMDAISFVLGIKSSHLRSTHLRDLVYRGRVLKNARIDANGDVAEGEAGEETGPQQEGNGDEESQTSSQRNDPQTAWVMAVYEDDAGEEHRWKRTITSSGQSEYRINNRLVSAKQYNESLEAENILIKARNFLVFQGDVETIASQSPKDLTRLIEQISGSLDYKAEYERLKIEKEKADEDQAYKLNQRRGINGEIKQYQQQKEELEKFESMQDEKDQAMVTSVLWKLFHFQRTIEDSTANIQKHQEELKEFRRNVQRYEDRLEEAKRDQAKIGREVSKQEREIKRREKSLDETKNALVPIDEKLDVSNANLERYEKSIAEIAQTRDRQQSTLEHFQQNLETVQRAQQRWDDEFSNQQQLAGRELSAEDLQEYQRLRSDVYRRSGDAQMKVNDLSRQMKTDEETVNNLKSKVDSTQSQVDNLDSEIKGLKERRSAIAQEMKSTNRDVEGKKKAMNAIQSELTRTDLRSKELNEKLRQVAERYYDATQQQQQTQKETHQKETVAAMKRIFPGVKGMLNSLCKPKQKKYEAAVITVLGRHFDSVVVDSKKTAEDCIYYLKDQRAGQATFIPLDTIVHEQPNSNFRGLHRGARLAVDCIECDPAYERALSFACGNAIVTDTLDIARELCYGRGISAKAVTLDGTVIHKGGNMTGGESLDDRKRRFDDGEIENLYALVQKFKKEIDELPSDKKPKQELEALQSELDGLGSRLSYRKDEDRVLERNLQDKTRELQHARKQLSELSPKYGEQLGGLETLRETLASYQEETAGVEDEVFVAFCERLGFSDIREYDRLQGSLQAEAEQKRLEFTRQISRLENQISFQSQQIEATAQRIRNVEAKMGRDRANIAQLQQEKDTLGEQMDQFEAEIEDINSRLESIREDFDRRGEAVVEARREVQKRSKNVEKTLKEVAGFEDEIRKAGAGRYGILRNCKVENIMLPLGQGSRKIDSLPLDDAALLGDEEDEEDAMEIDGQEVGGVKAKDYGIYIDFSDLADDLQEDSTDEVGSQLEEKIANLQGDLDKMAPNMRSADRLEATSVRLQQTEREFNDARNSAKKATKSFETIRQKRSELFTKAFNHIADQIKPVYRDLTRTQAWPLGGQAYLDVEDETEPYLMGVKYHVTPPAKRFRDMEHLSGGEKTMAALALLFAIHTYAPSPFFVLDEVDAALDHANTTQLARYVREKAGPGMQFVVISLKTGLFQNSETLVGVMRDQGVNSSKTLTLDLRKYQAV